MRSLIVAIIMLATPLAIGAEYTRTFPLQGKIRSYTLIRPATAVKMPVVIVLHGGGSNGRQVATQSQMSVVGPARGFAVCYPNGTTGYGQAYTWNSGACCGWALNNQIDDVAFISRVIDDAITRYNIDPSRVYITGMSNGAQMAWHATCQLPGKITAMAAVASTASIPEVPQIPTPIMQISGLLDENAPFYGGVGRRSLNKFNNLATPSVVQNAAQANRCGPPIVERSSTYIRTTFPAQLGGKPVVMYLLPKGGHTWPGGVDILFGITGPLVKDFKASEIMLDFFKEYKL